MGTSRCLRFACARRTARRGPHTVTARRTPGTRTRIEPVAHPGPPTRVPRGPIRSFDPDERGDRTAAPGNHRLTRSRPTEPPAERTGRLDRTHRTRGFIATCNAGTWRAGV